MKVKVTRTTIGYFELKPEHYPEGKRTVEAMIELEKEAAATYNEYMDGIVDSETFKFELKEEEEG
jgi:hypothetical protein